MYCCQYIQFHHHIFLFFYIFNSISFPKYPSNLFQNHNISQRVEIKIIIFEDCNSSNFADNLSSFLPSRHHSFTRSSPLFQLHMHARSDRILLCIHYRFPVQPILLRHSISCIPETFDQIEKQVLVTGVFYFSSFLTLVCDGGVKKVLTWREIAPKKPFHNVKKKRYGIMKPCSLKPQPQPQCLWRFCHSVNSQPAAVCRGAPPTLSFPSDMHTFFKKI